MIRNVPLLGKSTVENDLFICVSQIEKEHTITQRHEQLVYAIQKSLRWSTHAPLDVASLEVVI